MKSTCCYCGKTTENYEQDGWYEKDFCSDDCLMDQELKNIDEGRVEGIIKEEKN